MSSTSSAAGAAAAQTRDRNGDAFRDQAASSPKTDRRTEETRPEAETGRTYSGAVKNPYARYTTGAEEDNAYTASFKPAGDRTEADNAYRRRSRSERYGNKPEDNSKES